MSHSRELRRRDCFPAAARGAAARPDGKRKRWCHAGSRDRILISDFAPQQEPCGPRDSRKSPAACPLLLFLLTFSRSRKTEAKK